MGYKKYAADYEIEYIERLDKKRPQAKRIYVGPYFVFNCSAAALKKLRVFYIALCLLESLCLLAPMCIDCGSTRTWYVQLPAACAWIGWVLAVYSVWTLCCYKERAEREQRDGICDRMSSGAFVLVLFTAIAFAGSLLYLVKNGIAPADILVLLFNLAALVCALLMFSRRNRLEMKEIENPEKPQTKKKN